jgi:hypothetical protein
MIGSGLSPRRIAGQVTRRYAEPLSEPTDRNHRSSPNVVGYPAKATCTAARMRPKGLLDREIGVRMSRLPRSV